MVLVDLSNELKCGVADSLNLRVAVMKKIKQVGGCLTKIKIMKNDGYFLEKNHLGVVPHVLPAICVAAELIENVHHLKKMLHWLQLGVT